MSLIRKSRVSTNRRHRPARLLSGSLPGAPDGEYGTPSSSRPAAVPSARLASPDDLSREVYCILGLPVDAIGMDDVLPRIRSAAAHRSSFLISTPNLNFLALSRSDREFRESLILSDLCTADGVAITWIARLAGIPIRRRVTGADIFDTLKAERKAAPPLNVFLFGGAEGVAAAASRALNDKPGGLRSAGWLNPGFCSVDEMSTDAIVDHVNASCADFLVVALGARKGQLWLLRNHRRLRIPVRAHLGASLNFQAATVRRAPSFMRRLGLEWLWRIKEEPYLWRRYWQDGRVLARLLLTHVLPSAFWTVWLRLRCDRDRHFSITQIQDHQTVTLSLAGPADGRHVGEAIPVLKAAIATRKQITLDFSKTGFVDARFLGLLLMLQKMLGKTDTKLAFQGLSGGLKAIFRINRLGPQ